jgi:hypothetical protein
LPVFQQWKDNEAETDDWHVLVTACIEEHLVLIQAKSPDFFRKKT